MIVWFKRNILRQSLVKCYILNKQGNTYKIKATKHINIVNQSFHCDEREHTIDLDMGVLDKRNNLVLFYDTDKVNPINFDKGSKQQNNAKLLKTLIQDKSAREVLGSSYDSFLLIAVIGLIVCLGAVSIFAIWQITQLQNIIAELSAKIKPPIIVNP